jgi:hypothetical protein
MTAVEFLHSEYKRIFGDISIDIQKMFAISDSFAKAKEMEKQEKLESFIEGYKQRAEKSNLIFDNASRMYAINLFEIFNLPQQDKP